LPMTEMVQVSRVCCTCFACFTCNFWPQATKILGYERVQADIKWCKQQRSAMISLHFFCRVDKHAGLGPL
jgi:hypothetical protein